MTNDQLAASIDALNAKLDQRFAAIDARFENIERHMVTKSDVFTAVLQGVGFLFAAIVGTVVVLSAAGLLG